ncbi:hypothetical protein SY83_04870 [Paenibacillus swuensis]|uniref:SGNH hydrolase-type esterase domain-containing protein n=1 Tax=Paenibacillus swuensis TaxID=1178515 RepID=A0A172TFC4_9BACL|nr:SGNH/GDSL hydrolase family protein [Paenibacillus swuensis]ANE45741.1 hypothetical protein SY83_04870 [Paenibacillus swuensis]
MNVIEQRSRLQATLRGLREGKLKVGFLGTSITDARVNHNWPEAVMRWFSTAYPHVKFQIENAAIAGTGSELAVFRAKRDITDQACDLVFVEYAVNDPADSGERRIKVRESLLRQLMKSDCDIVLVYTFHQSMYGDMAKGNVPDTVAEFERLAEHYRLNTVWMSLHAIQQVKFGLMRWEEWLPDGLHPTERGSLAYAESVIEFLKQALRSEESYRLPAAREGKTTEPLIPGVWEEIHLLPLEQLSTEGPWLLRNWPQLPWIHELLETSAIGAKVTIPFEGRGIALGFDFGFYSAEFRYALDGGEWLYSNRERPYWYPDTGLFIVNTLFDDLPVGPHELSVEVIHGDSENCKGTRFRLAFAAEIR